MDQFKKGDGHVPIFDANQVGKMGKISELTSPEFLEGHERYE
jgi:hypothetical protein